MKRERPDPGIIEDTQNRSFYGGYPYERFGDIPTWRLRLIFPKGGKLLNQTPRWATILFLCAPVLIMSAFWIRAIARHEVTSDLYACSIVVGLLYVIGYFMKKDFQRGARRVSQHRQRDLEEMEQRERELHPDRWDDSEE